MATHASSADRSDNLVWWRGEALRPPNARLLQMLKAFGEFMRDGYCIDCARARARPGHEEHCGDDLFGCECCRLCRCRRPSFACECP